MTAPAAAPTRRARFATFKAADVERAIRAAQKTGLPISGFEIDPQTGRIKVHTLAPTDPTRTKNDFD